MFNRVKVGDVVYSKRNYTTIYRVTKVHGFLWKKVDVFNINDVELTYQNQKRSLFYKI